MCKQSAETWEYPKKKFYFRSTLKFPLFSHMHLGTIPKISNCMQDLRDYMVTNIATFLGSLVPTTSMRWDM